MNKQAKSVSLTAEQKTALHAIWRRRKVDALVWKRARAFILLDDGYDAKTNRRFRLKPQVQVKHYRAFPGTILSLIELGG